MYAKLCYFTVNTRPRFIALYFDQPDHSAHEFGPGSLEVHTYSFYVNTMLRWDKIKVVKYCLKWSW